MVIEPNVKQGDILKIEKIKHPVLVVSKDFFNTSGAIIGCPIYNNNNIGPLHIAVNIEGKQGFVQCEKLALLDLNARGYKKLSEITMRDRMEIADAIQGIFDYI